MHPSGLRAHRDRRQVNWCAILFPTVLAGIKRQWLWLLITAAPVVLISLDILPGGLGGRFVRV
jgi:hypothetical protein